MPGGKDAQTNPSNEASKDSLVSSQRCGQANSQQQRSTSQSNKSIHRTISLVRKLVKTFKKENLGAGLKYDFLACSQCLEEGILSQWKLRGETVKDFEAFLNLTLRNDVDDDEDVSSSNEYIDLISISKRAQAFSNLISNVKLQLLACLSRQVHIFCGSLKEMARDKLLIAVTQYQTDVCEHRHVTDTKLTELEKSCQSYKQLVKPFTAFVRAGEEHSSMMNRVCNNLLELCQLMEAWVRQDDQYPDRLLEEFHCNQKVRHNLQESLLQIRTRRQDNMTEIERLKKSEVKAEQRYNESWKVKVKLKTRRSELERKRAALMNKIERKRQERDDQEKGISHIGHQSPRQTSSYQEKLCQLEEDIVKLESEMPNTDKLLKRLGQDLKPVNERTYELKVDAVTFRHRKEEVQREDRILEAEARSVKAQVDDLDDNNELLMMIRAMKVWPELWRSFTREQRRRAPSDFEGRRDLDAACRLAARWIGKDWQKVYLRLPFVPPRDMVKCQHDLQVLDYISVRNDIPWSGQALRSLEKWLSFHRRGNVRDLVQTLRAVGKKQAADDLDNHFL